MDPAVLPRRITIDNEPEWLRIKDNVIKGMNASMETRLATLPGGTRGEAAKTLRKEVEARLSKIQEEMFKMVNPNLRVNGHNYEDFVDATEPFDEALDRRIYGLHTERLQWNTDIAARRKTVPADVRRLEESLERRKVAMEYDPDLDEEDVVSRPKAEDIPAPPRHAEVKETFATVVSNFSELAATAPAQLKRAQRAQSVREEIANMPA